MDAWNVFDYSLVVFSCADLATGLQPSRAHPDVFENIAVFLLKPCDGLHLAGKLVSGRQHGQGKWQRPAMGSIDARLAKSKSGWVDMVVSLNRETPKPCITLL